MMILLPDDTTARDLAAGTSSCQRVASALLDVAPLPIRFPFTLLGMGHVEQGDPVVTELSTPLDNFLLRHLGLTLDEALLVREQRHYDFKLQLAERNERTAQEI